MIYAQDSLNNAFTANVSARNLSREIITVEDVLESQEDEAFKVRFNDEAPVYPPEMEEAANDSILGK